MTALVHQRCRNHAEREAAVRCPACRQYFCRECVSEHDDRSLCASCLLTVSAEEKPSAGRFKIFVLAGQTVCAVLLIWFFFYVIGSLLLAIPESFHEGTIWKHLEEKGP